MEAIRRILVVDDQITNIETLKYRLNKEGYEVLQALRGDEAIELTLKEMPDLVLLDIMMPEISGFEVCKTLTEHALTKDIPIILVTALSSPEYVQKGFEVGAFDYVKKPFNNVELMMRIKSALISSASSKLIAYIDKLKDNVEALTDSHMEISTAAESLVKDSELLKSKLGGFLDEEIEELIDKITSNGNYIYEKTNKKHTRFIQTIKKLLQSIKNTDNPGVKRKTGLN